MHNVFMLLILPVIITVPMYRKRNILKTSFFFLAVLVFIISLLQAFMERGSDTIACAICHFSAKRLWIYCIMEAAGLVVLYLCLQKLLKEKLEYFIGLFNATLSIWLIFIALFNTNASNWLYISIFTIATMISISAYYWLPERIQFVSFAENRLQLISSILVGTFFAISTLFFIPNEIVMTNSDDMHMPIHTYVIISVVITLIAALLMSMFLFNLSIHCNRVMCVLVFAFLIAGYIQSNFLNGKMSILAGDMQNWTFQLKRSNAVKYILIIAVITCILLILKETIARKAVITICAYLSLIMISTIVYMGITSEKIEKVYLDNSKIMEVGASDNVIVFVLDRFDTQIFNRVLKENSTVDDFLNDFTYYPDMVSPYCYTAGAVPYLLTGWKADYNFNNIHFMKNVLNEGIRVDNSINKSFKFYHVSGTHSPFTIDDSLTEKPTKWDMVSSGIGCLKIVNEYINQMKELGI